ncbi:MAG: signal peptidase II [Deltaproteobacteria bacterium]|nr:signal peptidase II [Deltaproteobacteria bacterium]
MLGGAPIGKNLKISLITGGAVVIVDQIVKLIIMTRMAIGSAVEVIPGLFNVVYIKNPGAAFGIFTRGGTTRTVFLIAVTAVALIIIRSLLRQSKNLLMTFGLSLIAGGAVGNLIDRLRFGSVVDFLDFYIGPYHWPAFNAADSAITTGVILALLSYYIMPSGKEA